MRDGRARKPPERSSRSKDSHGNRPRPRMQNSAKINKTIMNTSPPIQSTEQIKINETAPLRLGYRSQPPTKTVQYPPPNLATKKHGIRHPQSAPAAAPVHADSQPKGRGAPSQYNYRPTWSACFPEEPCGEGALRAVRGVLSAKQGASLGVGGVAPRALASPSPPATNLRLRRGGSEPDDPARDAGRPTSPVTTATSSAAPITNAPPQQ